ncbi:hypothetical protein PoB_001911700 [Plakobranchus ocellatus]|uniref:Uncharacterized protein n=1 Tax=Plakobranchus ocellatus TaxID=259542 RepID=A0AAV3ZBI7_9GAST|nr:hypothetical protein PoB_001911700 [Plakobranchus ocellatus]
MEKEMSSCPHEMQYIGGNCLVASYDPRQTRGAHSFLGPHTGFHHCVYKRSSSPAAWTDMDSSPRAPSNKILLTSQIHATKLSWTKRRAEKLSAEANATQPAIEVPKKRTQRAVKDTREYWRKRKCLQKDAMSEEQKEAGRLRANELRRQKRWLTSNSIHKATKNPSHPVFVNFPHPVAFSTPIIAEPTQKQSATTHPFSFYSSHSLSVTKYTNACFPITISNKKF